MLKQKFFQKMKQENEVMFNNTRLMIPTFASLFIKDMTSFFRSVWSRLIDTSILLFTNVVVFAYFMPQLNTQDHFGPFLLVGAIISFGFFDVIGKVSEFLGDIDGDSSLTYLLSMPISSGGVFAYYGVYWAICSMIVGSLMFPLGKLLLLSQFDLSIINYGKLIVFFITANTFFGFFAVWLSAVLKNLKNVSVLWLRVLVPMFMFGCYFYPFFTLYNVSHVIAGISLINPMVYAMEGVRAATLGQEGFLNFWVCLGAMLTFTVACGVHGIKRLKKRLDCI